MGSMVQESMLRAGFTLVAPEGSAQLCPVAANRTEPDHEPFGTRQMRTSAS